jgi:enoyl-CoA hydratase/carnithine racemase
MNDRVRIDVQGTLAQVILNRADKHNAMDFKMIDGVLGAIAKLKKDRSVRAVILSGDGPSFCSGIDFKSVLAQPAQAAKGYAQLYKPMRNDFQQWSMGWRDLGVPVIACVHGNCFGAGIQLALGADIRIATPDAKLSVMEVKWGLVPDMGGAALLRELVGIDRAKELAMTGRIIGAMDAHALGLVTHVAADPVAHARTLIAEIETRSPDAVAAAKFLMQDAWSASENAALSAERRWQRRVMGKANQRIAVKRNTEKKELAFGPRKIGS